MSNIPEYLPHEIDGYSMRKEILDSQGGACAICGREMKDVNRIDVVLDHDHTTGFVRGILCRACNCGLGFFRDNLERMKAAVKYLEDNNLHNRSIPFRRRGQLGRKFTQEATS